jgi:hypothetical protein
MDSSVIGNPPPEEPIGKSLSYKPAGMILNTIWLKLDVGFVK